MNTNAFAICLLGAAVAPSLAAAQDHPQFTAGAYTVTVDGQIRPRAQINSGRDFADVPGTGQEFITQRARLGVAIAKEDDIRLTLRIQDVRIFGEETDTMDPAANGLDVHEAYLWGNLGGGFSLAAGRMELSFDNERLIGAVDWTQRARSFDGARVHFAKGDFDADAFWTLLSESLAPDKDGSIPATPAPRTADVNFMGAHAGYAFAKGHRASLAYYVRRDEPLDETRHTAGATAMGAVSGFNYSAEFYSQFGTAAKQDLFAMLAAARAGYTLDMKVAPGLTAFFEYIAGDGTPEGAFDTLYATNHKFYGEGDYFLALPKDTALLGLMDAGARLSLKPYAKGAVNLDFHIFRSVEADAAGNSNFGNELDVKFTGQLVEHLDGLFLFTLFLPGDTMGAARGMPAGAKLTAEHATYIGLDAKF